MCFLSFPDSNSGCMGDTVYSFRIRHSSRSTNRLNNLQKHHFNVYSVNKYQVKKYASNFRKALSRQRVCYLQVCYFQSVQTGHYSKKKIFRRTIFVLQARCSLDIPESYCKKNTFLFVSLFCQEIRLTKFVEKRNGRH